jgi:hypothetical protein
MTTIEVSAEQLSRLIVWDLKKTLALLEEELIIGRGGIWSHDVKEDRKIIKKHIKAYKLILADYGWSE